MKAVAIASVATHRAIPEVPENPAILSTIVSQLRTEFGYGCAWKRGGASIMLRDMTRIVVPRHQLKTILERLGSFVWTVDGRREWQ